MSHLKLALYFLRLGASGFGGPLALIAQMQDELIEKRKIVDPEEFRQALALIKSLPGPIAVQVVTYIGNKTYGWWFGICCAILFILPASLMMVLLAAFYQEFHSVPFLDRFLVGMQGGAFILIASALRPLAKSYWRLRRFWISFLLSLFLLGVLGLMEPVVIFLMAFLAILLANAPPKFKLNSFILLDLFLVCLKAGGLAFGTGIAILPLLQHSFVNEHHWISKPQFMEALAFGQLTPGPISVSVTFVGYRLAGWLGALVATIGIFAPGIFNMTTWFPRAYTWFSKQKWVQSFTIGAIGAICAGIVLSLKDFLNDGSVLPLIVPLIVFLVSLRWAVPSWAIILVGGLSWALF